MAAVQSALSMDWGTKFTGAFVDAYRECRQVFSPEQWAEVWTTYEGWNRFVLWNPTEPQKGPVLSVAASKMGLSYWAREPFRLDGAFTSPDRLQIGNYPRKLLVALEHESDPRTFSQEIFKLFHLNRG